MLSFPRYQQTRFGQKVGDFLNGEFGTLDTVHPLLVSLLFAGDRFESRELIEQSLADHDVVVCDRYVASNVAHQGAKVSDGERAELIEWIQQLEFSIYKLPTPQLTLFLDLPVKFAQQLFAAFIKNCPKAWDGKRFRVWMDSNYGQSMRSRWRSPTRWNSALGREVSASQSLIASFSPDSKRSGE